MEKELTVVIPSKNEENYIAEILENLSLQRIGKTEIILADALSEDNTRKKAQSVAFELGLNLKIIEGGLPAVGRNRGAKLAKTPYVLFVDADVTFTDKCDLRACLDKMNEGYKILSTTPKMRSNDSLAVFLLWLNRVGTGILSKTEPFAIGAMTLVNKEEFLKKGGYDEEVKHTEDWLLSKKYSPKEFCLKPDLITQDDRRFKRFGYWKMSKLIYLNWMNRNNREYFLQDAGYWS